MIKQKDMADDDPEEISVPFLPSWVEEICIVLCNRCFKNRHGKYSRRKAAMERAREQLALETNIIAMVKFHRYLNLAIKHLLPGHKRHQFLQEAKFKVIDPDLESDSDSAE